jgi:serine/threonine protein kinase
MAFQGDDDEVPERFICTLSQDVMDDPVVTADGYTYERVMIEGWLRDHNTSPRTNLPLADKRLTPNQDLKAMIREWREKQTISIPPQKVVCDMTESNFLGEGAWGKVYKGTLRISSQQTIPIALKTISNGSKTPEEVAKMLSPEIKMLKATSFRCSHTTKLYGTTLKDNRLCIVMKLYSHSLLKAISDAPANKMPVDVAVRYGVALFRALSEIHDANIVSRDIKPDNILFDEHGSLFISDFGISFQVQNTIGQLYAQKTGVKGTLNYMPQELFDEGVEINGKVDVWAGACCIVQMLTGNIPFKGLQMAQIMRKVSLKQESPPEASSPDVPDNIKAILVKCFQYDPRIRPTAKEVVLELEKLSPQVRPLCHLL